MTADLAIVDNQIKEVEAIISESKSVEEGIKILKDKFEVLKEKLPQQEESAIGSLSDLAKKSGGVEIISINPQPKTDFLDADNNKVMIDGHSLQNIPVALELSCTFKDLIEYIDSLKVLSPAFITIESLTINRATGISLKLNIHMDIKFYVLSEK